MTISERSEVQDSPIPSKKLDSRISHRGVSREEHRDTTVEIAKKAYPKMAPPSWMSSMKLLVLFLLCMQNTMFTVLRRYSQGVLKESYSKVSRSRLSVPRALLVSWHA
jgi:hypothetical protein